MPACVLAAAYGIREEALLDFRAMMSGKEFWKTDPQGEQFHSPESAIRGVFEYLRVRAEGKKADGVRPLVGPDIVHFRRVEIRGDREQKKLLRGKISGDMEKRITQAEDDLMAGHISREEFRRIWSEWPSKWEELLPEVVVRNLAEHYYAPLVSAKGADYVRHVVKTESEADFLADLEGVMASAADGWDGWMFSKLDEATDRVFIPYRQGGELREFHPDFVFWMCRGGEYRIVFVDPKGTAFADAQLKLDGYAELFEEGGKPRVFPHDESRRKVTVALLYYNPSIGNVPAQYRRYWTDNPSDIFAD